MKELAIFIDTEKKESLYEQIYDAIRNKITDGTIKKGEMLPSTRSMALQLQISRSTVLSAYMQLVAEGYLEPKPQKGYFVVDIDRYFTVDRQKIEESGHDKKTESNIRLDFSPNGVETIHFPFNEWKKISKQIFIPEMHELFNGGNPKGDDGLRKKIAELIGRTRGVKASKEQIIIGSGNENLMNILKYILPAETVFATENPMYGKSYRILKNISKQVIPVNLDENGIDIELLEHSNADIVSVTPSHQYPLGIVMSIKRRVELLNWAYKKKNRYIIEDDYDSEFRYKGKPVPSLQSIDTEDKVIYIGTFSKTVSPAIRMSYMVLPKKLCSLFDKQSLYFSNTVSRIDQKYMEIFIESGGYEKHLNRMKTIYKAKHESMLEELKFFKGVEISGENAGAHIILKVKNGMSESELLESAAQRGIRVYPLSAYYINGETKRDSTVLLGYARLSEEQIKEGMRMLRDIWNINKKAEV